MVDRIETVNVDRPSLTADALFETRRIGIVGMTCDQCVRKVEHALRGQPGVQSVRVDRQNGLAEVTFDTRRTNIPSLHDALLASGYKPADGAAPA